MSHSERDRYRIFGVDAEILVYDMFCLVSIVSILVIFSKTRVKKLLKDAISRRLVVLCGISLVYEFKFRLGQQMSYFNFMRNYGYTLISISQLTHFTALIVAIIDAFCWTVFANRANLHSKTVKTASLVISSAIVLSSIAIVCFIQFYRRETSKIFLPKQLAELISIPLALVFFSVLIFWRSLKVVRMDRVSEMVLGVYTRMIVVTFACNCLHTIMIMIETEWATVHLIHALDGLFFGLIAYKLELLDVDSGDMFNDQISLSVFVDGKPTS